VSRRLSSAFARLLILVVAVAIVTVGGAVPRTLGASSGDVIDVNSVSTAGGSAAAAVMVVPMACASCSAAILGAPIVVPSSGSTALTQSASASSEGFLTLSGDSNFLTLAGYRADAGTASVASSASSTTKRVAGRIDASGTVDTTTALAAFTGNNVRSAVSNDGTQMWLTGAGSGDSPKTAVYATTFQGTTGSGIVTPSPTGARQLVVAGGGLYFSTTTTVTPGIYKVGTGLPTSGSQSTTPLVTGASLDPFGFALVSSSGGSTVDTLYMTNGTNGGITKYVLSGGTWTSKGTIASTVDFFGVAAKYENGGVQLYATTEASGDSVLAANAVDAYFDTGGTGAPSGTLTTIATALGGRSYRGIAFGPTNQQLTAAPPTISLATTALGDTTVSDTSLSRTIGDSYSPNQTTATISDSIYPASQLTVTATSDNPSVVPSVAASGTGGSRTLTVTSNDAVGIANITVTVSTPDGRSASTTLQYGVSAAAPDATSNYLYDFSNASTAIDVGGGYFLVGDDSFNDIALYQAGVSGPPVATWNFDSSMGVKDTSQLDLEASARIGNTIYWVGSEGNSSTAPYDYKPNRTIIFATTLSGSGASASLSFVGFYKNMRADLINWDIANGNRYGFNAGSGGIASGGQTPKEINGFNIEGAEFAAGGSGTLYLGFRAPIVPAVAGGQALVVPITNLASLISGSGDTGSASFGTPLLWSLTPNGYTNGNGNPSALGIREIRKNADDQYLIIAGSYEGVPAAPSGGAEFLYSWDGNPSHQPIQTTTSLPTPDDGSWETIVSVPDPLTNGAAIRMIQDNGDHDYYNTGAEAKDLPAGLEKDRTDVFNISLPSTTLTPATATGTYGGTTSLTATLTFGGSGLPGRTVIFTLNGTIVGSATTDASGVATLNGVSLAGITAGSYPSGVGVSTNGDGSYAASSGTSSLTVAKADQTIVITQHAPSSAVYGTRFTVAAGSDAGNSVTYSSSGGCTNTGADFTMTSGSTDCTVAYDQAGDENYNAAPQQSEAVTTEKADQSIVIATPAPSSAVFGTGFTVAAKGGGSGNAIVYGSSGGCSNTDGDFTVTSGSIDCTVTYDQAGDANYKKAQQQSTLTTTQKASQTITLPPIADHTYGDADFDVSATPSSGDAVDYAVSGHCFGAGQPHPQEVQIHITGAGSCTVTASQDGDANYNAAPDVQQTFSVGKAGLTITPNGRQKYLAQSLTLGSTEFSSSGLVGSDSVSAVTLTSAGAAANAATGDYSIAASNAVAGPSTSLANYTVSYHSGTLHVSAVGIIGLNGVFVATSGGKIDSFDGSAGAYGSSNHGRAALVMSNGPLSFAGVSLLGSTISTQGSVSVAHSASVSGNVTAGTTASIAGTVGGNVTQHSLSGTLSPLAVAACAPFSTKSGISGGSFTYSSGTLVVKSGIVKLANGTYCFRNVTVDGGAVLSVSGPVTLNLTGKLTMKGKSPAITNTTGRPSKLHIATTYAGPDGVAIVGAARTAMTILAPRTNATVARGSFYGTLFAATVNLIGGVAFHADMH
jgi:hypothetical protein